MKRCTICGEEKPLECFQRRKNYSETTTVYYYAGCIECLRRKHQDWLKTANGSCAAIGKGRKTRKRKHSACLPVLQFQQG